MTQEITNVDFESIISENDVVVVDFWAPWCGPCRTLGPIVEAVDDKNDNSNIFIGKVNVDSESDLAGKFGVRSIPTIVYFKNGEAVERTVGIKSQLEIEEIIKKLH